MRWVLELLETGINYLNKLPGMDVIIQESRSADEPAGPRNRAVTLQLASGWR